MGYDIKTDNLEYEKASEKMMDAIDEPVKKTVEQLLEELKAAARNYQTVKKNAEQKLKIFKENQDRKSALIATYVENSKEKKRTKDVIAAYRQNKEYQKYMKDINKFYKSDTPNNIINAALNLQETANRVLGQTIKTVFVFENDKGFPEIYELGNINEFLKYDVTSKTHNLTARINLLKSQRQEMAAISKTFNSDNEEEKLEKLNETYKEVMQRYRDSKIKTVMWNNPNPPEKYNKMKVSSQGDINEAYASIFLQNLEKEHLTNNMEQNIQYFMKQVEKVDATSGLLQGDVTIGKIEYAVKSINASILGLSQFDNFAEQVLKNGFDIKKLEEMKLNLKKKPRNKIQTTAEKIAIEKLEQTHNEIKNLTK